MSPCFGQEIVFSGQVIDSGNFKPIHGAEVYTSGNQDKSVAVTDEEGFFSVVLLSKHKIGDLIRLRITRAGYKVYDNTIEITIKKQRQYRLTAIGVKVKKNTTQLDKINPTLILNYESFMQSIHDRNYKFSEALLKSGIKLKKNDFVSFYNNSFDSVINVQILKHKGINCSECPNILDPFYYKFSRVSLEFKSIQKLCKCNIDVGLLDSLIKKEAVKMNYFKSLTNDDTLCLKEFNTYNTFNIYIIFEKYVREAANYNIFEQLIIKPGKETIIAEIYKHLLVNPESVNPDFLKELLKQHCPQFYYRVEADSANLKYLNLLKDYWREN